MAREFTLHIECGNAAFEDNEAREVSRILKHLAAKLEHEDDLYEGNLHDYNGNTVGSFSVHGVKE